MTHVGGVRGSTIDDARAKLNHELNRAYTRDGARELTKQLSYAIVKRRERHRSCKVLSSLYVTTYIYTRTPPRADDSRLRLSGMRRHRETEADKNDETSSTQQHQ